MLWLFLEGVVSMMMEIFFELRYNNLQFGLDIGLFDSEL
jgi:hypothetical protein